MESPFTPHLFHAQLYILLYFQTHTFWLFTLWFFRECLFTFHLFHALYTKLNVMCCFILDLRLTLFNFFTFLSSTFIERQITLHIFTSHKFALCLGFFTVPFSACSLPLFQLVWNICSLFSFVLFKLRYAHKLFHFSVVQLFGMFLHSTHRLWLGALSYPLDLLTFFPLSWKTSQEWSLCSFVHEVIQSLYSFPHSGRVYEYCVWSNFNSPVFPGLFLLSCIWTHTWCIHSLETVPRCFNVFILGEKTPIF